MKTSRRKFIESGLKASAIATIGTPFIISTARAHVETSTAVAAPFQFSQITLPYAYNALEPHIDAQTMEIHYTKHHTAYIKNVNEAITAENVKYENEKDFFSNINKLSAKLRNNGGGAWNHNFFWQVMKPGASPTPNGKVAEAINSSFGSFEKFKEQFTQAAMTRFGSGWAWLVNDNGKLKIGSTANQDNPLMDLGASDIKGTPLLALDVWEHAYYLKYQNKRNEYVASWWNVVNWEEVAKRIS
ncbi:MAG TPA: superoxide dismutase [Chryseosolibacter sp.]